MGLCAARSGVSRTRLSAVSVDGDCLDRTQSLSPHRTIEEPMEVDALKNVQQMSAGLDVSFALF